MKKFALRLAGTIFLIVSLVHFYRYHEHLKVTFGHYNIPLDWSLYGGVAILLLAIFMFYAVRK